MRKRHTFRALRMTGRVGHALPASFSATFRYLLRRTSVWSFRPPSIFWSRRYFGSDNAPGISALRSFNPAIGRSNVPIASDPACRRMNVHLDAFCSRDRPPSMCLICQSSGRPIKDVHFGFRDSPYRQAGDADPGSIAYPLLPWDFPVSGLRTPESVR